MREMPPIDTLKKKGPKTCPPPPCHRFVSNHISLTQETGVSGQAGCTFLARRKSVRSVPRHRTVSINHSRQQKTTYFPGQILGFEGFRSARQKVFLENRSRKVLTLQYFPGNPEMGCLRVISRHGAGGRKFLRFF